MKKLACINLVIVFLVAFSGSVQAAEIKVAYVDMQEALNISEAGKKAKEVFKGEVDRLQKDLDKHQAELKAMNDELEKQSLILSEETRLKKEKEYQEKLKEFQRFYQDSQEKLQEKDAQLTRTIIIDLRNIIAGMGRDKGYTFILEKNESNMLYADKSIDLTADVVKKYNERSK